MKIAEKGIYATLFLAIAVIGVDRAAAFLYRPAEDATDIVVYTTDSCPYCKKLKAFLDRNKIPYTENNIYKSPAGAMGFWTLRGRGVPISTIGPDVIHGYQMKKIQASLAKLGYQINTEPKKQNAGIINSTDSYQ